jgi:hypothetical protein
MVVRRTIVNPLLFVGMLVFASCNLGIEIPDYFIAVRTKDLKLAYNNGSNIVVEYKFVAENEHHRCEYILTDGGAHELQRDFTDFVDAGQWHDLPAFSVGIEGKYSVRVIVQSQNSDGNPIDMSFLDKAIVFYFDNSPPSVPPEIDPQPVLSSEPVDVVLIHVDQSNPDASPVTFFYTLDGTLPNDGSALYSGSLRIEIPDTENTVPLQAIAVDSVDLSSDVAGYDYHFLDIKWISNLNGIDKDLDQDIYIDSSQTAVVKELHGVGFYWLNNPPLAAVFDHNGTPVSTTPSVISDELIRLLINLDSVPAGPWDPVFEVGQGTVEITDTVTGVTDIYEIVIQ